LRAFLLDAAAYGGLLTRTAPRSAGVAAQFASIEFAWITRKRVARRDVMSKKDLIDAVASEAEITKEKAGAVVDAVIKHIEATMKNGAEVRLPGFGTFKVGKRAARKARNPQTGKEMMLKASVVPKFQPSKTLKDALNVDSA
jgi:DNA-binding protein HU-beta